MSVRRPWRRRGLARALVAESLRALRDAGMTSAVLGVDADNPTGALGVYEDNGFVHRRGGPSPPRHGWDRDYLAEHAGKKSRPRMGYERRATRRPMRSPRTLFTPRTR